MSKVKTLTLRAPGTNCDAETVFAFEQAGAEVSLVHVNQLIRGKEQLAEYQIFVIPGGFTYGDDIAAGKVLANELRLKLNEDIPRFMENGGLILGICNGFQVLLELELLPGAMLRNKNLKFLCNHVHLRIENDQTPYSNQGQRNRLLRIPIAHFDGNYYASPSTIEDIKANNQIVFRYVDDEGRITEEANVNGSLENIAGLVNKQRNVLGMMPHPERASESLLGSDDGRIIFESIIHHLTNS